MLAALARLLATTATMQRAAGRVLDGGAQDSNAAGRPEEELACMLTKSAGCQSTRVEVLPHSPARPHHPKCSAS